MSGKELNRLHVIRQVLEKKLRQSKGAEILLMCVRQVRRLMKRLKDEGDRGIIHRSRGRESKRRIGKKVRAKVIEECRGRLKGFGPTLVSEKVMEEAGIKVSEETVRKWMRQEGIEYVKRKGRKHRSQRERREHKGEMLQMDGSHHDWLEGRGPKMVLMGCIDDASGRVAGGFYAYEGTTPAFDVFKRYVKRYGIPCSVYLDRHTTYKSNKKLTLEEQLAGVEAQSQFERAMKELGVQVIHANSPEGKGRVERLFNTLQDRLVKEMRLAEICTEEQANQLLPHYWSKFNRKFSVEPAKEADLHRPVAEGLDLDSVLCIKAERRLRRDFTVSYGGQIFQVLDRTQAKGVTVQQLINGRIRISYEGTILKYKKLAHRIQTKRETPSIQLPRKKTIPAPDHPWRHPAWMKKKQPTAGANERAQV